MHVHVRAPTKSMEVAVIAGTFGAVNAGIALAAAVMNYLKEREARKQAGVAWC